VQRGFFNNLPGNETLRRTEKQLKKIPEFVSEIGELKNFLKILGNMKKKSFLNYNVDLKLH